MFGYQSRMPRKKFVRTRYALNKLKPHSRLRLNPKSFLSLYHYYGEEYIPCYLSTCAESAYVCQRRLFGRTTLRRSGLDSRLRIKPSRFVVSKVAFTFAPLIRAPLIFGGENRRNPSADEAPRSLTSPRRSSRCIWFVASRETHLMITRTHVSASARACAVPVRH